MTTTQIHYNLLVRTRQFIPANHAHCELDPAWIKEIANKLPGKAQRESRVQRFLKNASVPVAFHLLQEAAKTGEMRLIIDATRVTAHHQQPMAALAYRARALPIAWTWKPRGHSSGGMNYLMSCAFHV